MDGHQLGHLEGTLARAPWDGLAREVDERDDAPHDLPRLWPLGTLLGGIEQRHEVGIVDERLEVLKGAALGLDGDAHGGVGSVAQHCVGAVEEELQVVRKAAVVVAEQVAQLLLADGLARQHAAPQNEERPPRSIEGLGVAHVVVERRAVALHLQTLGLVIIAGVCGSVCSGTISGGAAVNGAAIGRAICGCGSAGPAPPHDGVKAIDDRRHVLLVKLDNTHVLHVWCHILSVIFSVRVIVLAATVLGTSTHAPASDVRRLGLLYDGVGGNS